MSATESVARVGLRPIERLGTLSRVSSAWTACAGVVLLVLVAPYESLRPLLTVPGQTLTTVEAALLLVFAASVAAWRCERGWPRVPRVDALVWGACVGAAFVAALLASSFRGNALHMSVRVAVAAAVWALTVCASSNETRRAAVATAVVVGGACASVLVLATLPVWPP